MAGLLERTISNLRHSWSIWSDPNKFDRLHFSGQGNGGYYSPPSRMRSSFTNERTLVSSIHTRMSIDVAAIDIRHVRLDSQGRYQEDMNSTLQDCLTVEANLDQAARQFRQDIVMTLFEKGVAAIVPVVTDIDPEMTNAYTIQELRVGEIVGWSPTTVRVNLYNQIKGERQQVEVPKTLAAVVENPLYAVMNEPNSTLKRLTRKLSMLDDVDEQASSGKLDMIIQLPYVIKSEARRQQAEQRRKDIEFQLKGSQYGIAYTDGTEKITQLNRPVTNDLLDQIKYLTDKLYTELGLTPEVMNGTADEKAMINYFNRTIEPVVQAIAESMRRTFLSKTARTQGQSILYFRDPFKLVPMEQLAEIVDKFSRNEILAPNEIRGFMGIRPSSDPKADQLINSNMPQTPPSGAPPVTVGMGGNSQNGS